MTAQLDLPGSGHDVRARVSDGIEVRCRDARFLDALRARLRYANPAYANAVRLQLWVKPDKHLRNYRDLPATGDLPGGVRIPRGAAVALREIAGEFRYRIGFDDQRLRVPAAFPPLSGRKQPTDLQERAIAALLKRENAYLQAPTGFGKGLSLLTVVQRAGQRALVMVPKSGLVDQIVAEAADLIEPGVAAPLKGKPHDLPLVAVSTYALLSTIQRLQPEWWQTLRQSFGCVVVDEMHRGAASTVRSTVDALPARYRFGVSATTSGRKDGLDFFLYDLFGPLADVITLDESVDAGRIVPVPIEVVKTGTRDREVEALRGKRRELTGRELRTLSELAGRTVATDPDRALLVAGDVLRDQAAGLSCLVLCRALEHVELIANALAAHQVYAEVFRGGASYKRQYADGVERMRARESLVAVASSVAFEGLDIPCLERGFIAVPSGTNLLQLEQMLGRFRRSAPGKADPLVRYYLDEHLFPGALRAINRAYPGMVTVRGDLTAADGE